MSPAHREEISYAALSMPRVRQPRPGVPTHSAPLLGMGTSKSPRQQPWLHRLLVALVALGFLTLVLQVSSLLGSSGDQLTGSSRLRRAIGLGISWRRRSDQVPVVEPEDELQLEAPVKGDAGDPDEVSDDNLLHLSLLHERCVSDTDAVLPWQFGSPGHQLPNASASNPEVVMHRNDTDLLQKLRQCPDVDIFLPNHLHGNGYCEDAVAYAKCEYCRGVGDE
ncbi:unnamed protein product [Phytophthora lilii]|uniref:Unnamed protein product n=1 Tax=Phytophthora lilii TaxID=2077276 RepID=A0A9W6WXS5_9STRA|nr:unnamed protein product [Phytophthora lilii]